MILILIGLFASVKLGLFLYRYLRRHKPSKDRFVFLVGCDSGFGYSSCWYLHEAGCSVIAGCLKVDSPGAVRLRKAGLPVIHVDVCDLSSVALAVSQVALLCGRSGLEAVVHNAGVLTMGRLHWLRPEHIDHMVDVNLRGTLSVARAVYPLLASTGGRLVLVSSPCSVLPCQELAPYVATKAAINALAGALRCDWKERGVSVAVLMPGDMVASTDILSRQNERMVQMWSAMSSLEKETERADFEAFQKRFVGLAASAPELMMTPRLRRAVLGSVLDRTPRHLYTAVELGTLLIFLLEKCLPSAFFQLLLRNHFHFKCHAIDVNWLDLNNIV